MPQPTVYNPFTRKFQTLTGAVPPGAMVSQCPLIFKANARRWLDASEKFIIEHESSGRTTALNTGRGLRPSAAAFARKHKPFGIGQLTIENRILYGARLGINPDTTDFYQQLEMMRAYIADKYGTSKNAELHWATYHNY